MPEKQEIVDFAYSLNVDMIGFTGAASLDGERLRFENWIKCGCNAGMKWLERDAAKRFDPGLILPDAKTVIIIAVSYNMGKTGGPVSRYASAKDYHVVLKEKLKAIGGFIRGKRPGVEYKAFVDSSPLAEKSFAARAGLGWIGRNSILVNERLGSLFFIGELIVDIEYETDGPARDMCGECRKCVDACPTGAIRDDRTIDAARCMSYWTIEDKGYAIPDGISLVSAYGCDICQEACPWNSAAAVTSEPSFMKPNGLSQLSVKELMGLGRDEFAGLAKATPLKRVSFEKFMANLNACRGL